MQGFTINSLVRSLSRTGRSDSSQSSRESLDEDAEVTVGYEMELMIPCLNRPSDPHPDDERWCIPFSEFLDGLQLEETIMAKRKIVEVIREAGLPSILNSSEAANPNQLPPQILASQYYQVVQDASLHEDEFDSEQRTQGYEWVGAELVSRVLRYPEESTTEMDKLCHDLRHKMRLHLNRTTGFHVHIGISHLRLTQIKKFLSLYWVVESILFVLVAPHRLDSFYCNPVRGGSYAASEARFHPQSEPPLMKAMLPEGIPDAIRSELVPIWKAKDRYKLRDLLLKPSGSCRSESRNALAFRAHGPVNHETNDHDVYTAEFRHLQGTVNPALIKKWTDVIVALLRGATKSHSDYRLLVQNLVHSVSLRGSQAWPAVLSDLGLGTSIPFWARQLEINYREESQQAAGLRPRNPLLPPEADDDGSVEWEDFTSV